MEKYLTEMLHMDTKLVEATELYDHLPLLFKGTYVIYKVNSGGVEWIALQTLVKCQSKFHFVKVNVWSIPVRQADRDFSVRKLLKNR